MIYLIFVQHMKAQNASNTTMFRSMANAMLNANQSHN